MRENEPKTKIKLNTPPHLQRADLVGLILAVWQQLSHLYTAALTSLLAPLLPCNSWIAPSDHLANGAAELELRELSTAHNVLHTQRKLMFHLTSTTLLIWYMSSNIVVVRNCVTSKPLPSSIKTVLTRVDGAGNCDHKSNGVPGIASRAASMILRAWTAPSVCNTPDSTLIHTEPTTSCCASCVGENAPVSRFSRNIACYRAVLGRDNHTTQSGWVREQVWLPSYRLSHTRRFAVDQERFTLPRAGFSRCPAPQARGLGAPPTRMLWPVLRMSSLGIGHTALHEVLHLNELTHSALRGITRVLRGITHGTSIEHTALHWNYTAVYWIIQLMHLNYTAVHWMIRPCIEHTRMDPSIEHTHIDPLCASNVRPDLRCAALLTRTRTWNCVEHIIFSWNSTFSHKSPSSHGQIRTIPRFQPK